MEFLRICIWTAMIGFVCMMAFLLFWKSDKGAADIFQVLFVSFYMVSVLAGVLHLIF
ncbi:hypothetical protein BK687P1_00023 [Bacteroides phage BK687P1]|nr:hypothetical protein BK687P1_00023 [Bacteroides phage BK687P1]